MLELDHPADFKMVLIGMLLILSLVVEADLIECGLNIFMSTPSLMSPLLIQFAIGPFAAGVKGLYVIRNKLLCFLKSLVLAKYSSR